MATKSHGHLGRLPTQNRLLDLRPAAFEAVETVLDMVCTNSLCEPCRPDGDWVLDDDLAFRKTWRRVNVDSKTCISTDADFEERVQIRSDGLTSGWVVAYQSPDGREMVFDGDEAFLDREEAYACAETLMDDLEDVPEHRRTGRAAV